MTSNGDHSRATMDVGTFDDEDIVLEPENHEQPAQQYQQVSLLLEDQIEQQLPEHPQMHSPQRSPQHGNQESSLQQLLSTPQHQNLRQQHDNHTDNSQSQSPSSSIHYLAQEEFQQQQKEFQRWQEEQQFQEFLKWKQQEEGSFCTAVEEDEIESSKCGDDDNHRYLHLQVQQLQHTVQQQQQTIQRLIQQPLTEIPDDELRGQGQDTDVNDNEEEEPVDVTVLQEQVGKLKMRMRLLEYDRRLGRLSSNGSKESPVREQSLGLIPENAMGTTGQRSTSVGGTSFYVTGKANATELFGSMDASAKSTDETRRQSMERWKVLHEDYNETYGVDASLNGFSKKSSLVFMHPEEVAGRNYTDEELGKVMLRPFPSRIFITNVQVEWNTLWLRTRHTDHHAHRSSFIQVRDALKADFITNNPLGAKYALTELFNMCYGMDESNYYSFACTLASAFSEEAMNTEFSKGLLEHTERKNEMEEEKREIQLRHPKLSKKDVHVKALQQQQEKARKRLLQLMDIVFSKLKQKKLLVDERKHNIYRVVMCMTHYNQKRFPYFYAVFSFLFQFCAAAYVALSLTRLDDGSDWDWVLAGRNFALAVGTACYGVMVAYPEMKSTLEVFLHFYHWELSWLALMDAVVNLFFPLAIAFGGFFVVLQGETFLDGVLNSVALIFITEIDDQLPRLLELDTPDIVQGFLIDQAMDEYEYKSREQNIPSIQFSDMHITNTEESGSRPSKGVTFQPYEVFGRGSGASNGTEGSQNCLIRCTKRSAQTGKSRKRVNGSKRLKDGDEGQQVANKRSVTKDCLLKKISWQYTKGFDNASRPRIGHLKLEKLVGHSKEIEIIGKQKAPDEMNKPWYSVRGVYIITSFSMSDDVLRLRICGSNGADSPDNFMRAFDYYNLWPLDPEAREILTKVVNLGPGDPKENEARERVLYGSKVGSSPGQHTNGASAFHVGDGQDLEIDLGAPPSTDDGKDVDIVVMESAVPCAQP